MSAHNLHQMNFRRKTFWISDLQMRDVCRPPCQFDGGNNGLSYTFLERKVGLLPHTVY